jgi:hypothetical protein
MRRREFVAQQKCQKRISSKHMMIWRMVCVLMEQEKKRHESEHICVRVESEDAKVALQ